MKAKALYEYFMDKMFVWIYDGTYLFAYDDNFANVEIKVIEFDKKEHAVILKTRV